MHETDKALNCVEGKIHYVASRLLAPFTLSYSTVTHCCKMTLRFVLAVKSNNSVACCALGSGNGVALMEIARITPSGNRIIFTILILFLCSWPFKETGLKCRGLSG